MLRSSVLVGVSVLLGGVGCASDDAPVPASDTSIFETNGDAVGDASSDALGSDAVGPDATVTEPRPIVYFELDEPLRVELVMAPEAWDTLRFDSPGLSFLQSETCPPGPRPAPFGWQPATLVLNGHALGAIEIRKKGFLGSMTPLRPSFKIKSADGSPLAGLDRLTLNNDKSDDSHLRQCLAYQLFADAGLVAPRCGLASVSMNGVELGVYTHVESIDRDFLKHHYGDDTGDLYEGQLADFRSPQTVMFEAKNRDTDDTLAPVNAVAAALLAEGAPIANLEPVLDVDRFFTYWAMEVMVTFWDGYAGNTNNYYAYRPRDTGLMQLIPWGTDEVMKSPVDFADGWLGERGKMPYAVFAHGFLANRLYNDVEGRARYLARLRERLAAWDEAAIQAWIDRAVAALEPLVLEADRQGWERSVNGVRAFVDAQAARLTAELDAGLPEWDRGMRLFACAAARRHATGSFEAPWDTLDDSPLVTGSGAVTEVVGAETNEATLVRALSGPIEAGKFVRLQVGYGPIDDGRFVFFEIDLARELVRPGRVELDGGQGLGRVALIDIGTEALASEGFIIAGHLVFEETSMEEGGVLRGTFDAPIAGIVWDTSDPLAPAP